MQIQPDSLLSYALFYFFASSVYYSHLANKSVVFLYHRYGLIRDFMTGRPVAAFNRWYLMLSGYIRSGVVLAGAVWLSGVLSEVLVDSLSGLSWILVYAAWFMLASVDYKSKGGFRNRFSSEMELQAQLQAHRGLVKETGNGGRFWPTGLLPREFVSKHHSRQT